MERGKMIWTTQEKHLEDHESQPMDRDVRPKIEVAYLSTKFILMDREKNIKLNGKKMTVIEFTVQKLQIFEYLIFGVFPEIIQ